MSGETGGRGNVGGRLTNEISGNVSESRLARFERRSCLMKIRYSVEPPAPNMTMRAYPCQFCNGWHLARKSEASSE